MIKFEFDKEFEDSLDGAVAKELALMHACHYRTVYLAISHWGQPIMSLAPTSYPINLFKIQKYANKRILLSPTCNVFNTSSEIARVFKDSVQVHAYTAYGELPKTNISVEWS